MPENHTPITLDIDASMDLPIGTEIVDAEGYWRGRTYVKTGRLTWAHFHSRPNPEEIRQAVEERRNNLSPGNLHTLVHVYEPDTPMTGLSKPDPSRAVASSPPPVKTTPAIKAAAEAMEDAAFRLTGQDLDTIYRDRIARETLTAALSDTPGLASATCQAVHPERWNFRSITTPCVTCADIVPGIRAAILGSDQ